MVQTLILQITKAKLLFTLLFRVVIPKILHRNFTHRVKTLSFLCSGHDKTMKILIEHGADLDSKSVSPLLKNAAWEGNSKIFAPKISALNQQFILFFCSGYAEVVKILIDHGADVNYLSKELDWSPLYNAAFWGIFKTITLKNISKRIKALFVFLFRS